MEGSNLKKDSNIKFENVDIGDDTGTLKKGPQLSPDMREQIDKMLKGKKLKDDLVNGKIKYEDLKPEDIEAISKAG